MILDHLRHTGFRRQLTLTVGAAILGLALFSSLMNSWQASRSMEAYLVKQGQRIAENLARQSILALLYRSPDNAREAVAATLAFPDVVQVEIADASHRVLLSQARDEDTAPAGGPQRADPVLAHPALEWEDSEQWLFGAPVYGGQAEASPFDVQERQPQLLGHVHVTIGKGTLKRLITLLLAGNLAITLSIAALLLGMMRMLTRRLLEPLRTLSKLMGRAEAGQSGMRAVPNGPSDIVEMAHAFNKMMDVLEEREAELKQSRDEALRVALMKTQFAATVSHELRTPLNGVIGMLDMLKEMRLTGRQQQCVEVAWSSARTLAELVDDILDFSKMEAGKLELEEIEFDLRKLLEDLVELLARQSQQKGLEIGYLMAPDVPERIRCDPLRLRQVLLNLLGNAVKFTGRGEVAVRVSVVPGAAPGLAGLRFEVADSGIGMTPDAVRHVFESFAQADPSTTRRYGGTGLGLAICKQLVTLMKGEIGVISAPGAGSTFWFTVSCCPCNAANATMQEQSWQGARMLVVDPSALVRDFVAQSAARCGMRSHAAASGAEALAELGRARQAGNAYQLAVMDADLTDGAGVFLAQRMRAELGPMAPRILALTRQQSLLGGDMPGADLCIGKPLRLERLLEAMRRLVPDARRLVAAEVPPQAADAPQAAGHRVLVVEDNRTNQMVAAGMLTMSGCECELVANGREAVEAVRRSRFDLILMDCSMPEMDGYEATAHIRNLEEPLGRHTPIVAMTANAQPGDAEKCLAAGMDDYFAKPVTLNGLRRKLARWLTPDAQPAGE